MAIVEVAPKSAIAASRPRQQATVHDGGEGGDVSESDRDQASAAAASTRSSREDGSSGSGNIDRALDVAELTWGQPIL